MHFMHIFAKQLCNPALFLFHDSNIHLYLFHQILIRLQRRNELAQHLPRVVRQRQHRLYRFAVKILRKYFPARHLIQQLCQLILFLLSALLTMIIITDERPFFAAQLFSGETLQRLLQQRDHLQFTFLI